MMKTKLFALATVSLGLLSLKTQVAAQAVLLQQPTATYSQALSGTWAVDRAVDGNPTGTGWAVQQLDGFGAPETAVFETGQDVGHPGGTLLTFRLSTRDLGFGVHNLGRFRLSITTDDRSEFADGLANNGDVTANWEVLDPVVFQSTAGTILTRLPDRSILASGPNASAETYTVIAQTLTQRITGVRLETLSDPSLPSGGPGRSLNGNFILVNFTLTTTPGLADLHAALRVATVDICWPGLPTRHYQIQYSSPLTTNEWLNFGPVVEGNGANCVTDEVRSTEQRFYRVTLVP
jgi:hypothetical protein